MRKNHLLFLLTAATLMLMASCAKEGPNGAIGPAGPGYTGSIAGYIKLYDQYGSQVLINTNHISLELVGTAAIVTPNIYTNDSATGSYIYTPILTGTYILTATDTSVAQTYAATALNLNFVSGTLYADVRLSARPDSFITSFTTYLNPGSSNDSLVITVLPDARPRKAIFFMGNSPYVNNLTTQYLLKYITTVPANATTVTQLVPRQDLTDVGYASGTKIYYAAYSYVVGDVSVYEDQSTGRNVYNAVNTTPIVDTTYVP